MMIFRNLKKQKLFISLYQSLAIGLVGAYVVQIPILVVILFALPGMSLLDYYNELVPGDFLSTGRYVDYGFAWLGYKSYHAWLFFGSFYALLSFIVINIINTCIYLHQLLKKVSKNNSL